MKAQNSMNNVESITLNPNDEFLDPFSRRQKRSDTVGCTFSKKKLEPFEIVVIHSLVQIGEIMLLAILFSIILRMLYFELIANNIFAPTPITIIAAILFLTGCIFFLVFIGGTIKRAKKQNKNLNIKNFLMLGSFTAAAVIICKCTYINDFPNKILYGILIAAAIAALVFIITHLEKEEKTLSVIYLVIVAVILLFFIGMRVMFTNVYYAGADFQAELFCLQARSVDNIEPSVHAEYLPMMEETNDYMMYYFNDSAYPDHIFSSREELDEFFASHKAKLQKEYADKLQVTEIEEHMYQLLYPALEKFDSKYFEKNIVVLTSFNEYYNADQVELDTIFTRPSMETINYHTKKHLIDNNNDNTGIYYAVISVPKKYESDFHYEKVRYPEELF